MEIISKDEIINDGTKYKILLLEEECLHVVDEFDNGFCFSITEEEYLELKKII